MPHFKYSICITHYNNASTVGQALDSILNQIDERFEVIVVDNLSRDGSREILDDYAKKGKIKLIEKKCSRGLGRQTAFENSSGDYVIANLDMDDIFSPKLNDFVEMYSAKCEGNLLRGTKNADVDDWAQNVTMAPRTLLLELGGWPDLQLYEDWYLWARAAKLKKYSWTVFPLAMNKTSHPNRRTPSGRFWFRFLRYRESMRIGRTVSFSKGEKVRMVQRIAKLLAQISLPFHVSYSGKVDLNFEDFDASFRVE